MPIRQDFRPSASHAALGDAFYDPVQAATFPRTTLRWRNERAAASVGLDALTDAEWIAHFGRFEPLPGSLPEPLALRYHGHQFRTYNPDLGDGRGFLFAQVHDLMDGRLLDLGTKGSGRTPWSRGGDGRLTLKGGVREVLATEMLEALGVTTSKSFSLIETGEALMRGDEPSPTRSSVLVRLSHSHIRIGTFQRLAFLGDEAAIARLLDYSIATYMPELADNPNKAAAFLTEVCRRVARLGAQWMAAGFVHGVLNTDNINITGESFDYGPWRFLAMLDPAFTAAYFDETGLYAFGRQPEALLWNLTRLAECLLPLSERTALEAPLSGFQAALQRAFAEQLAWRLGLSGGTEAEQGRLAYALWTFLEASRTPFQQVFFDWFGGTTSEKRAENSPVAGAYGGESFAAVRTALAPFAARDSAALDNAYFAGPSACTMLIDEVEAIWAPIAESDDWSRFQTKIAQIGTMREALGSPP